MDTGNLDRLKELQTQRLSLKQQESLLIALINKGATILGLAENKIHYTTPKRLQICQQQPQP